MEFGLPWLAFHLLGIGRGIRDGIGAFWTWLWASSSHMLFVLLLASLGGNAWLAHSRSGWEQKAEACAAAHKTYVTTAKKAYDTRVIQVQHTNAAEAKVTQEHTDALQTQLDQARAAADAYARRMRIPPATTTRAQPGVAASVPDSASPVDAGDRADGMVAISSEDLNTCTTAIIVARGWQAWYKDAKAAYEAAVAEMQITQVAPDPPPDK